MIVMGRDFFIVLRGYDIAEVDRALEAARQALASGSAVARGEARAALAGAQFPVKLRGYDRAEVDQAVAELAGQLDG